MQKSTAISSSVKTTAMATPIKDTYTTEQLADISPRGTHSPSPHRTEEGKVAGDMSPFRRDSSHRVSGLRNISAPTFIKRAWSMDGQKRHRIKSECARNNPGTPPRMDLVSKSVRESPSRRPFSANFDDTSYSPRPLSASRTTTGQSAPAYFFLGNVSPYNSPPSLKEQSPLQITMGEPSPPSFQPFTTPPELSETTIMDVSFLCITPPRTRIVVYPLPYMV